MTPRAARALRGAVFAALATLVAAVAHTFAGGGAPSPLFCLVVAALVLPVTTAIARRTPSLGRTALAVGGAQAFFHTAFAVTGDFGMWQPEIHQQHHGSLALAPVSAVAAVVPDLGMLIAHAVAAALTIAAVYRSERVVRAVREWLPRLVRRVLAVIPVPPLPRAPRAEVHVILAPAARPLIGSVGRRGPPRTVAFPA